MTRRTTIASQKGGAGKTTVTLNLGLAMAERGDRTLIVDLDPQGGIGHSLCQGDVALSGIADVLMGACEPSDAVIQTKLSALSILPRGKLDAVDVCEFEQALLGEGVLEELFQSVEGGFDHVFIDTPSGLGMPTRAALATSDFALVPLQGEPLALRSVHQILRVIDHVKRNENERLELLGLLPTMVDRGNQASLEVLIQSWRDLAGVFETIIPRADVFLEASETGLPLAYLSGPKRPEARRFEMLANEISNLMNELTGTEAGNVEQAQRQLL
ncbi:MAG: chromosome partitioning protein [Deltaproteobacteria bacterium]|nr:MAG: chromosome partitioning protein [Deltaproteobacteria bacterium]